MINFEKKKMELENLKTKLVHLKKTEQQARQEMHALQNSVHERPSSRVPSANTVHRVD